MNPRSWAEIVVATLIAVMIPIDACSILVAIFVIVHMLMISVEAGVTAVAFFLFLLLTYFIFKPRQSVLITVMCLAGMLNLTGAAAIPIGLLCGPIAVIPAAAGIIGEYIAILFTELKDRPVYIVEKTENM